MKFNFILFCFLSLNSFLAQAQSYFSLKNGVVISVDEAGHAYDRSLFMLPNMLLYSGGQFYVNEEQEITAMTRGGFYFRPDVSDVEAPKGVKYSGYNYFIEHDGTPWTIDSNGFVAKLEKKNEFKKPVVFGGQFFVIEGEKNKNPRLFIVSDRGQYNEMLDIKFNPGSINDGGNVWFKTTQGAIYTLSQDGILENKEKDFKRLTRIDKKGGNFLVAGGNLWTIDSKGTPHNKGPADQFGKIEQTGHNFFFIKDGGFRIITTSGDISEEIKMVGNRKIEQKNIAFTAF